MTDRATPTADSRQRLLPVISSPEPSPIDAVVNRIPFPNSVTEELHGHISQARDSIGRWGAGVHSMLSGLQNQLDNSSFSFRASTTHDSDDTDGGSADDSPENPTLIDMQAVLASPAPSSTTMSYHRWPASHAVPQPNPEIRAPSVNPGPLPAPIAVPPAATSPASPPTPSTQQPAQNEASRRRTPTNLSDLRAEFGVEAGEFLTAVYQSFPIIVLLVLKVLYMYSIGILVFTGLTVIFSYCNRVVKREIARHIKLSHFSLSVAALNGLTAIVFTHTMLSEKVYRSFLLKFPNCSRTLGLFDVIWIVVIVDYTIRIATILVKIIMICLPSTILSWKKRGKCFLCVEMISQTYRLMCPAPVWFQFLVGGCDYPALLSFDAIFAVLYVCLKAVQVVRQLKELKKSFVMLVFRTHGTAPTKAQLTEMNNMCPICHDNFVRPARMHCGHIFCDDCIEVWLDRERSCPMCRTAIVSDVSWRDGATAVYVMLF